MFLNVFIVFELILILVTVVSNGLNILAVMPHQGKSHQLVFEPLFRKLVSNGHNLTLITRFPQSNPMPNWRDISIIPEIINSTEIFTFSILTGTSLDKYVSPVFLSSFAYESCNDGLPHPNFQNFLKEDNHFDIILMEVFNTPCFIGLTKRFNVPVIGLASSVLLPWMHQWFGTDSNPSFVPNHFLAYSDQMGFFNRVENTLTHLYNMFLYNVFMGYPGNQLSKQYTGIDLKENEDLMKTISILLMNSHYSLNLPYPRGPNFIEIGGIYVYDEPVKPLPKDIAKFVEESTHGVIYMSMGSTMKGDTLPEEKRQAFIKAFSRLSQRVIWKWEGKMKNKPNKIMTSRWTPQRDILCHPNVKVFISHSGLLGTMEAVDCGKPILSIPLFGDQFGNAKAVEKNGGGLALNLKDINEEILFETLQKLLSPKFRESAKDLSMRFKDRPMPPMETALYWIDYVVRHKGAPFMKMASVDMPLYQYYLLDVIVFLSVCVIIHSYVVYLFVRFIYRKLFSKKQKIKKC